MRARSPVSVREGQGVVLLCGTPPHHGGKMGGSPRRSTIPCGISTGICLCVHYLGLQQIWVLVLQKTRFQGCFFIVLLGSRSCCSLGCCKVSKTLCWHSWLSQGFGPCGMAEKQPSAIPPTPKLLQVSLESFPLQFLLLQCPHLNPASDTSDLS